MTTFTLSVKVNPQEPFNFINAITDLHEQIIKQIGSLGKLFEVLKITSEDLRSPEFKECMLEKASQGNALFDITSKTSALIEYAANFIDGVTENLTVDSMVEKYCRAVRCAVALFDEFPDIKTNTLNILQSLIKMYPDHPYTKMITLNGSDYESICNTYFALQNPHDVKEQLNAYFDSNHVVRNFWLSSFGKVLFEIYVDSFMNVTLKTTSRFDKLNACAISLHSMMHTYGDENYIVHPPIVSMLINCVACVCYAIREKWPILQMSIQSHVYDEDVNDEYNYNFDYIDSLWHTSYDAWLENPLKFNKSAAILIKEYMDGEIKDQEMSNAISSDVVQSMIQFRAQVLPVLEDNIVLEDLPVLEDTPVVEDTSVVGDTSVLEDTTVLEDTSVVGDTSVLEDTTVLEDTSVLEDTTVLGEDQDVPDMKLLSTIRAMMSNINSNINKNLGNTPEQSATSTCGSTCDSTSCNSYEETPVEAFDEPSDSDESE
jgi:carbonic anhydrase/acetyltransferase-like protein (isoleucine patch superfamily)